MIRNFLLAVILFCLCEPSVFAKDPLQGRQAKSGPAPPPSLAIMTIEDEHFTASEFQLQDGKLIVTAPTERSLPLTEIQKVEWVSQSADLAADWLGQDGDDRVGVGSLSSANGIPDCHVRLVGIRTGKRVKQISIVRKEPVQVWRLNPQKSPAWKIAMKIVPGSGVGDFYFDPPSGDAFGSDFFITFAYTDGNVSTATVAATTHTSDLSKVESSDSGSPKETTPAVTLRLEKGGQLNGKLLSMSEESLILQTPWANALEIPLLQVQGIVAKGAKSDVVERYEQSQKSAGVEDWTLLRAKDDSLAEITGQLKGMQRGQFQFAYDGEVRNLNAERLLALVLASHPPTPVQKSPYQVIQFRSGESLAGEWVGLKDRAIAFRTRSGQMLEIPQAQVKEISSRNGRLVYLSDVEPTTLEHVPYFGRTVSYKRDETLLGEPLIMKGKTYSKGLAVPSRTLITYDLDAAFASFKSLLGFEESAKELGRVDCRILGDGKELLTVKDLRSTEDPKEIDVPVGGVRQLTLEVDFGEDQDVGDRVIWAMPRLYREGDSAVQK
jgi:hypothetical protein